MGDNLATAKTGGIFASRKFNISSSLPKNEFKVPEVPPASQKSSKTRSQRVVKCDMCDTLSVSTMKSTDSSSNAAELVKVMTKEFIDAPQKEIGDVLSLRESIGSFDADSEFSSAHEYNYRDETGQSISPRSLLHEISSLAKTTAHNANDGKRIQLLVSQLNVEIESYRNRIKQMKSTQDNQYGDLLFEKNEEINKLRSENAELKSELKKASEAKNIEGNVAKEEYLRKALKQQSDKINDLTYQLIDAQVQIGLMEKEKFSDIPANPCLETVKDHFNIIKEVLRSNQTMRQMIQSRKYSHDSNAKNKDSE